METRRSALDRHISRGAPHEHLHGLPRHVKQGIWCTVVYIAPMRTPPTLPQPSEPTETIRLTIPVSREVHETFKRLSKASGTSIGRTMGDWLGDTLDAAEFMAVTLEKARAAPKIVMQEMHAYALGLSEETGELLEKIREKGREGRKPARASGSPHAQAFGPVPTPPSNTGVTSNKKRPSRGTR